ncbi:hypothetical protein RvY_17747-2 [Ramazzottius varieornatus]|uniref:EGF-like domain-containing protein n=1 Tax=Ramazzottius varieornatus TaxID=947166 RepID=A0A1D1W6Y2_RAMVA|nr:hypothetical protein RvY_17747-2 [Ramazzottius varieornatus]
MTLNPVTDSWVFQGIACQERDFCLNDGICKFYPRLNARSCNCSEGYEGPRCEWTGPVTPTTIRVQSDTASGVFEVYFYTISAILVVLLLAILIYSFRTYRLLSTAAANPYSRNGSLYFRQPSTNSAHSNAIAQFQVVPQPKRSTAPNGLMPHIERQEKVSLLSASRKVSEVPSVLRQPEVTESQTKAEVFEKSADVSRWKKYQWLGFGPTSEESSRPHPSRPALEGSFTLAPPRPPTSSFERTSSSRVASDDRQL